MRDRLDGEEVFLANYSDQLSDLPLTDYIGEALQKDAHCEFHQRQATAKLSLRHRKQVMVTFDELRDVDTSDSWINGGYFVLRSEILRDIQRGEELVIEPFHRLASAGKLWTKKYAGFWRPMDTFKDKITFDRLHGKGVTPWEVWN